MTISNEEGEISRGPPRAIWLGPRDICHSEFDIGQMTQVSQMPECGFLFIARLCNFASIHLTNLKLHRWSTNDTGTPNGTGGPQMTLVAPNGIGDPQIRLVTLNCTGSSKSH